MSSRASSRPPRTCTKRQVKHDDRRHTAVTSASLASGGVDAASAAWILEAAVMSIIGRKGLCSSIDM
jgi:hypothetical protein